MFATYSRIALIAGLAAHVSGHAYVDKVMIAGTQYSGWLPFKCVLSHRGGFVAEWNTVIRTSHRYHQGSFARFPMMVPFLTRSRQIWLATKGVKNRLEPLQTSKLDIEFSLYGAA